MSLLEGRHETQVKHISVGQVIVEVEKPEHIYMIKNIYQFPGKLYNLTVIKKSFFSCLIFSYKFHLWASLSYYLVK